MQRPIADAERAKIWSDVDLRVYAVQCALQAEGAKAITSEIIDAAQAFYAFFTGAELAPDVVN